MGKRFVVIWFPCLMTDWFCKRRADLKDKAFVLCLPVRGRIIITEANTPAQQKGINKGMTVADARVIFPALAVEDDKPGQAAALLTKLCYWCIRYTPIAAIDGTDGIILDASGCAHLWGGEAAYLKDIATKFQRAGYTVHVAMADTIGAAWATAHFGNDKTIVPVAGQVNALLSLSPAALRLEPATTERLQKLGLCSIGSFISMPRTALRRRFGKHFLLRLDQALGQEQEAIAPQEPPLPYHERLPCMEPVISRYGIETALQQVLEMLCFRLRKEGMGLRMAVFKCYRTDGKTVQIQTGTNSATYNIKHLYKLFELKLDTIEPALGIELFVLEADKTEPVAPLQETLWNSNVELEDPAIAELLDRLEGKTNDILVQRFLPEENYWPELAIKQAASLKERPATEWRTDKQRPLLLLPEPELIQVSAPVPDYPPMNFRYKNKLYIVKKADGPERIERAWWLEEGLHRDYYIVEDETGNRYWIFRLGHYDEAPKPEWFLHGFFA